MTPTLTDYLTGTQIRPATREEWARSKHAAAHEPGGTGAFDLDGRSVFVAGDFPPAPKHPKILAVTTGGYHGYTSTLHGPGWDVSYCIVTLQAEGRQDPVTVSERVRNCYNACEGIADPAAALAEMRDVLARIARTPKHGEPEDADPQYTQDWTDPNAPTLATMHTMIDMARAALALLDPSTPAP